MEQDSNKYCNNEREYLVNAYKQKINKGATIAVLQNLYKITVEWIYDLNDEIEKEKS